MPKHCNLALTISENEFKFCINSTDVSSTRGIGCRGGPHGDAVNVLVLDVSGLGLSSRGNQGFDSRNLRLRPLYCFK